MLLRVIQKTFVLLLFLQLAAPSLHAQNYRFAPKYEPKFHARGSATLRFHYGYILNHAPSVAHLATQQMPGIELEYQQHSRGRKMWQQYYRYPSQGISLIFLRYDPKKPIGNVLAIVPHFDKKIIGNERIAFNYKIGLGLGFSARTYDSVHNTSNNMVSTFASFALFGQLNFRVQVYRHWHLTGGAGVLHLSNGDLKKPNQGINQITANAGVRYYLSADTSCKRDVWEPFKKSHHAVIVFSGGLKQHYSGTDLRGLFCAMSYYEFRIARKDAFTLGLDASYDDGKGMVISNKNLEVEDSFINRSELGLVIGHELLVNKIGVHVQLGRYLHEPLQIERRLYQRYAIRYYVHEKLFTSVALKVHQGSADWIEWGVGVKL